MTDMKGMMVITADHIRALSSALDQFNRSVVEMHRVSNQLIPEVLMKSGLQQAVQSFCIGLSESTGLIVKTQFDVSERRVEKITEFVLYRIIQALLIRIVKHGVASETLVQIARNGQNVHIIIEDNGRETSDALQDSEKTFKDVRSRVDYLNAEMEIVSIQNKGMSVHINCPVTFIS